MDAQNNLARNDLPKLSRLFYDKITAQTYDKLELRDRLKSPDPAKNLLSFNQIKSNEDSWETSNRRKNMLNVDKIQILLLENNPSHTELTLLSFKKHILPNRILVINDGAEALDYLFAKGVFNNRNINCKPKVIFLDLTLPKVSGLEILKKIKKNENLKIIPVVVLTASQSESDIAQSYRAGANGYIIKPEDIDKYTQVVFDIGSYWLRLNQPPPSKH
jgi:two-component system, response regulator